MDTLEDSKRSSRRRHGAALKAKVIAECAQPHASVASIAMAHGLNTNLVHKWRRLAAKSLASAPSSVLEFVPLPLAAHAPMAASDIAIELRHGAITVKVSWPLTGAASCAAWIREVLR